MTSVTESKYLLADSIIYRNVGEEIILVNLDSDRIYYFNQASKPLLDYLKEPRLISHPLVSGLKELFSLLVEEGIVVESTQEAQALNLDALREARFLRKDPKRLDEVAFLCP